MLFFVFFYSQPSEEPADFPSITFQAQQAVHAVLLQTPQPSAPFTCQEGGPGPAAQKWNHRSAQSCGRGSGCTERKRTWDHAACTAAPQEERTQTWKQGGKSALAPSVLIKSYSDSF